MLEALTHAFRLAFPIGLVLLIVAFLAAPSVGRRLGVPAWLALMYMVAVGGFALVTLVPVGDAFAGGWSVEGFRHLFRDMQPKLPSAHELRSLNEVSLNVVAAVPMGAMSAVLAWSTRSAKPIATGFVPVVCEFLQGLLPQLNRTGFVLADVINNEIGFVVGFAVAMVVMVTIRACVGATLSISRSSSGGPPE